DNSLNLFKLSFCIFSVVIEQFDCCLRRTIYKNKFEITYVGPSQVREYLMRYDIRDGSGMFTRARHVWSSAPMVCSYQLVEKSTGDMLLPTISLVLCSKALLYS
uniref:Uncharacterized protein n=1 Tax=Ficedula albicollis TaxID=59894 RepID=A0A803W460_FICAL